MSDRNIALTCIHECPHPGPIFKITKKMKLHPIFAAVVFVTSSPALSSDPCLDNFSASGSFFAGKVYKTWAVVPGIQQHDAYQRAYAFTAEHGFTILNANKEAGVISAAQSVSYGNGKTVPLTLTFKQEAGGVHIGLSYATSGGVMSPEDAIKNHFCQTIAAVSEGVNPQPAMPMRADAVSPVTPTQRKASPGYAMATPQQQQGIKEAIPKSIPNAQLRSRIAEASSSIAAFLERVACLAEHTGASALNEYAAPGANLHNRYVGLRPMRAAQYHNKAACMSVARVHGWSAPANNALRFEVIYKSDESGETSKLTHEAIKQPDGVWLFSQ